MGKGRMFWTHLAEHTEIGTDSFPGMPIVELAGNDRVLVENHLGIMGYGRERILIKVRYGCIGICGCELTLLRMTREQLVIRGKIESITLHRRN